MPGAESNGKEPPLWHKLYFREPYTQLARTIGYAGLSMPDAQAKIKPLAEKFAKELMAKIAEEIVRIDPSTSPPTARLKDHVRKLCWQLLGPPPEYKAVDMNAEIMAMGERLKADPKPEAPKKPRKPRAKKALPTPQSDIVNPLMRQYREAKEKHPNMLLLFRVGDFYELFEEDARTAAKLLGLTLTSRDKTTDMAGFPHHQLENYLQKLLKAGMRVAVCDQVVDSKTVKREATRVVTPGSIVEQLDAIPDDALHQREYELRQILDRDKTKPQMDEAMRLKAEIRRRAKVAAR